MEIFVIWLVLAIVGAIVASNKGRSSALWFVLCLICPILLLVVLALRTQLPGQQIVYLQEGQAIPSSLSAPGRRRYWRGLEEVILGPPRKRGQR